jgi:hypothetical protein
MPKNEKQEFETPKNPKPKTPDDIWLALQALRGDLDATIKTFTDFKTEFMTKFVEHMTTLCKQNNQIAEDCNTINRGFAGLSAEIFELKNQLENLPKQTISKQASKQSTPSPTKKSNVVLPPAESFPISQESKLELEFGSRNGNPTVKFKKNVNKDDWNKANTFLRALGMAWVSDKDNKIYEWQIKQE